ncbi:MAG TPA: metal ABC transporter ATP-binding protein [Candidatus Avacidaminococcus intestinavium]|uniref:Metal ABC transporter ATP-binding protein n=1 Tax=Candidatus Avacidaminococcus intestinavium TaxID=2840684 RepID=A0A9D1MQU3_9FIRM|nr:metal ABC transporter ATP-binding protein [Candidatus Avacidaminococcus intestinavium]
MSLSIKKADSLNSRCHKLCCTKLNNFGVNIGENTIFTNVNMHIHCGELTAIIGRNGAGKSTLLKAILGEIAHEGTLTYHDAKDLHTGRPRIGYVPQALRFDAGSPTSVLDLFTACLSRRPAWLRSSAENRLQAQKALANVQAEHLLDRRLGALSGGELQRVLVALALEPVPDLLLLDEPVTGIDQNGLEVFYAMVSALRKQHDLSIIIISHDFDFVARYADRVVLLEKTVVASGTPQEVFSDPKTNSIFNLNAQFWHNLASSARNGECK